MNASPSSMRKRYGAEAVGTFIVVFAPVALSATGKPPLVSAALVSGLAVLAAIYALGPISAAHFNPAVTLAFAAVKRFPARYVLPYVLAQIVGAVLAAGMVALLFGPGFGTHVPAHPEAILRNIGTEAILSFFLMLVIVAVATDRRVSATVPGLAIGLTVVFDVLIGGPVTGGSMNPARSFGPALFAGGPALYHLWIFVVGPCAGALLGALVFEAIRLEKEHAQGAPNELFEVLQDLRNEPA